MKTAMVPMGVRPIVAAVGWPLLVDWRWAPATQRDWWAGVGSIRPRRATQKQRRWSDSRRHPDPQTMR
jgi:hypothetical protein